MVLAIKIGVLTAALALLGAACSANTTVTTGDTNTTVTTNVNASITNTGATGSFSTNANY